MMGIGSVSDGYSWTLVSNGTGRRSSVGDLSAFSVIVNLDDVKSLNSHGIASALGSVGSLSLRDANCLISNLESLDFNAQEKPLIKLYRKISLKLELLSSSLPSLNRESAVKKCKDKIRLLAGMAEFTKRAMNQTQSPFRHEINIELTTFFSELDSFVHKAKQASASYPRHVKAVIKQALAIKRELSFEPLKKI